MGTCNISTQNGGGLQAQAALDAPVYYYHPDHLGSRKHIALKTNCYEAKTDNIAFCYIICDKHVITEGCYPDTHFWFEDTDTRQMAASFINFHTDSSASDTLFFIRAKSVWSDILECVAGDTVFHLEVCWLKGGYRSFKVDKTPFLNSYSTTYWEKLYTWDTTHLSQPDKYVVSDGSHYYIVRLIYRNRSLLSADFCHHDTKAEYDVNLYDPEKVITLPYPENKQWPKIL